MVHRWKCRHCGWATWSTSWERTAQQAGSHLAGHYGDNVSKSSLGLQWDCPYCDKTGHAQDESFGLDQFRDHLFSHTEALVESGVHVAEEIGGTGSILVLSELEQPGAVNARKHFLTPGDIVIFVTAQPARRIRLLRDELGEWPAWTVVMTSKTEPLAGLSGADPSTLPLEVVQLDGGVGLSTLGRTMSRILNEHEGTDGKISVEFDILSELISTFDLQQVFKFLHVFTARLDDANALSHFYADPRVQSESSVNVLGQVFDLRLTANDLVFTSAPAGSSNA